MANFMGVYLVLKKAINGRDAYLTYETKTERGSNWRTATFVTSRYVDENKVQTQCKWDLIDTGNGRYRIRSEANGMYLSYNHKGKENYVVKEWMNAEVMSGQHYEKKGYQDGQREWAGPTKEGGFVLKMTNNGSGDPLFLALDSNTKQWWAKACVNTAAYFKKKGKSNESRLLHIRPDFIFD